MTVVIEFQQQFLQVSLGECGLRAMAVVKGEQILRSKSNVELSWQVGRGARVRRKSEKIEAGGEVW